MKQTRIVNSKYLNAELGLFASTESCWRACPEIADEDLSPAAGKTRYSEVMGVATVGSVENEKALKPYDKMDYRSGNLEELE